jgi:hypothetical protein
MKKLIVVLMVIVCGNMHSIAQSMLRVGLRDGNTPINVSLDGRYFNKRGTTVTVGELPPGTHFLKIYTMSRTRNGRGREDVIYSGRISTDGGMATVFIYDPETGLADIQQQDMNTYTANHPRTMPGNNHRFDNPANNNNAYAQPAPVTQEKTGTLTDAKISDLKTQATAKKTDLEIFNVLKDGLKNEQVLTRQVGDMMDWFTFETSKDDFAKWAYTVTVDKEYFSDLENKFTYKSYQDDLDKFIKEQK